jgi:hypothetical protein
MPIGKVLVLKVDPETGELRENFPAVVLGETEGADYQKKRKQIDIKLHPSGYHLMFAPDTFSGVRLAKFQVTSSGVSNLSEFADIGNPTGPPSVLDMAVRSDGQIGLACYKYTTFGTDNAFGNFVVLSGINATAPEWEISYYDSDNLAIGKIVYPTVAALDGSNGYTWAVAMDDSTDPTGLADPLAAGTYAMAFLDEDGAVLDTVEAQNGTSLHSQRQQYRNGYADLEEFVHSNFDPHRESLKIVRTLLGLS